MSDSIITAGKRSPGAESAIAAAVLALLILWAHGWAMQGGWRIDDVGQLLAAWRIPVWKLMFDPAGWREFNNSFFTPGLALAYKFDQWVFGRVSAAHYAHVLFSLWFLSWLTFAVLRRYVGPQWALWASVLFVLSSPVAAVLQYIPARHYVEGLIFALLAVQFHLHGVERGGYRWFLVAALCYLMATLCKEVFAPMLLPLLVLSLSMSGEGRNRLAVAGLYGSVALLYVYWRSTMLGSLVGGYSGGLAGIGTLPQTLAALPWPILGRPRIGSILAISLVLIGFVIVALRNQRVAWGGVIGLVVVMAPFSAMPGIANFMHPSTMEWLNYRWHVLPVWCLCAGSAWVLTGLKGSFRYLAIPTAIMLTAVVVRQATTYSPMLREQVSRYDAQAKFAETHLGDALVLTSDFPAYVWAPSHVRLRSSEMEHSVPAMIHSGLELKRALAANQKTWAYDIDCKCVVQVSEAFLKMNAHRYQALARKVEAAPLAMFFELRATDREFDWEQRSPVQGEMAISILPIHVYGPVPRTLRLALPEGGKGVDLLKVYLDDLTGRVTETAYLPFPKNGTLVWHMGVFVDPALAKEFNGPLEEDGLCGLETLGSEAGRIDRNKAVPIRAWMDGLVRKDEHARDAAMALSQGGKIKYLAFLYRDPNDNDDSRKAHLAVLNADLTRILPGDYDVDLLGRGEEGGLFRCKTERSLTVF